MSAPQLPSQRIARASDAPAIATLMPLYRAFGFRELERVEITLADGVVLAGVAMERPISG